MADVFISYANTEKDKAKLVAESLEAAGFSVWWDRSLKPGETFDSVIQREIQAAKAIVVLWTKASVESQWVREEADLGRQRENLVPLLMDQTMPPIGFGRVQAAHLQSWDGDPKLQEWQEVVDSVQRLVGRPAKPLFQRAKPASAPKKRPPWIAIGLGAMVVVLVLLIQEMGKAFEAMQDPKIQAQMQAVQKAVEESQNGPAVGGSPSSQANPQPQPEPVQEPAFAPAPAQTYNPNASYDPYAAALSAMNPQAGQLQMVARAQGMTYVCLTPQGWCVMAQPGPGNISCWCPSQFGPVTGTTQ